MQIDPKVGFWLNIVFTVIGMIASGTASLHGLIPDPVAHAVVGWAGFIFIIYGGVNTALHGWSAPNAGPWVSPTPPSVPPSKIAAAFIVALLIGFGFIAVAPSEAQAKPVPAAKHPKLAPAKLTTPDQVIAKVLAWASADGDADLSAAIILAKASNNNVTLPCWTALQTFVKAVEALPPAASLPKLHLAVDVELATDLMIALQPNSPVVAQCQALANYQKMSAINMVSGIVTGALAIGKLPVPLPIP